MPHHASTSKNLVRTVLLSALSLLALLCIAPAANAATVGFYGWAGTAYYVAAPGEANNLTVSETPGFYSFSDPSATLTAQYGCTLTDAHTATCASKYVRSLYIKTGDMDDSATLQLATIPASMDCGAGTDTLRTPDPNTKPVGCEYINPPAPSPVAPPTVTPPLSIVQTAATMTKQGSVPLTLSCSASGGGRCVGTLTFEVAAATKSQVAASRRGAPNILGRERLAVAKGKKRKVTVSMTSKGRAMVKRNRKLKVTVNLKITQGGKKTTSKQSLTIKAPRRK